MNSTTFAPPRRGWPSRGLLRRAAAWLATGAFALNAVTGVQAAPPPAGTSISNQASATYTDGSGVTRTVSSNVVQTTVQQVASLTLAQNGAQTATPGSVVYYPHTLTNTGNGTDTFSLTTSTTGSAAMTNVTIYADNGSGQPTGSAITSTTALAAGASFKFIVAATLAATATAGQTNTLTVTGTSGQDGTKTTTNTDTTTVTTNAVITLTKAVSTASGAPGSGPYTYTLTYTNTGNSTATNVVISDIVPAGMTYVAGSGLWSVTGNTAMSDAGASVGTSPNTATSTYNSGTKAFAVTLAQVAPGQSGTISFKVNVNTGVAPGTLNNTATSSYNNGSGTTVTGSSNTVPFTVTQAAAVSMTGDTVAGPAAAGSTVSFTNTVTNGGNGTDTFNIALGTSTFPSGTTFQLFKSDGVTPLVDTNGDGKPDTGPVAAGATYNVIVKATLPPNATNVGAPFTLQKTATSVVDSSKSASTTDQLTAISGATVDVTNNAAVGGSGVQGTGAGTSSAVVTNTTNPGTTTAFSVFVNNTGSSPDSYNLTASNLPSGWTVSFQTPGAGGTCSPASGSVVSNTGNVAAGGNAQYCAIVTVPAGAAAGTSNLTFTAASPNSGASDYVVDAVTVNAVRSLSVTPNGSSQTYPGGSVVYSHTLTNTGNVTEGNGTLSTIAQITANNQSGWTSTVYYDANGNGVLDATDPQITGNLNTVTGLSAGLTPGQSITLFTKVIAPSGAVAGNVNQTSLTVTTTNGSYTTTAPSPAVATDSTTVIAGNVTLSKAQALDASCAGATGSTSYGTGNLSAKPGQCVLYQVTATNVGSADATGVTLSDSTPTYTTLSSSASVTPGSIASGAPSVGGTGTITGNVGTLTPGQSAVLTFGVKINQ